MSDYVINLLKDAQQTIEKLQKRIAYLERQQQLLIGQLEKESDSND